MKIAEKGLQDTSISHHWPTSGSGPGSSPFSPKPHACLWRLRPFKYIKQLGTNMGSWDEDWRRFQTGQGPEFSKLQLGKSVFDMAPCWKQTFCCKPTGGRPNHYILCIDSSIWQRKICLSFCIFFVGFLCEAGGYRKAEAYFFRPEQAVGRGNTR